jgi:uncharacterized protein (DUF169 family)
MTFQQQLGLSKQPIAVGFFDEAPAGIDRWTGGAVPAGCAFWREAMGGRSFYTVPADHYNCAVGAYTHNIPLPAATHETALNDTVGFMVASGYLQMPEVAMIPVLPQSPRYVAYRPVDAGGFRADVVVIAAKPAAVMLIYEAALRSGAGSIVAPSLGRPGCAVLPMAINSGAAAISFGCKGNRTFTGLPDEEVYLAVPGAKWEKLVEALRTIVDANATMEAHYRKSLTPASAA